MDPLSFACYNGAVDCIKFLLEKGADPCHKDTYGWTAMAWLLDITKCPLTEQERCDIMDLLFAHGGLKEINTIDSQSFTLCDWCATYNLQKVLQHLRLNGGMTAGVICSNTRIW